ncbi:MAG: type III secretion protein [Bilophila wadsworthia]
MADFMKVDMSRLGQAEGRSADSGMAAPSGADVDTFQQAMRRRPLDERQGSGGDESDGGRGASHAPNEDTSAEAEALSSMFSRMTGPLDTLFAGRTAQTAETAAPSGDVGFGCAGGKARGADSGFARRGHEIRLTLGKDVLPEPKSGSSAGATACCRYIGDGQRGILQTLVGAQESLKARRVV